MSLSGQTAGSAEVEEVWTKLAAQTSEFIFKREEFYRDVQSRQDELAEVQQAQQSRQEEISGIDAQIDKRGSEEARDLSQKRKTYEQQHDESIAASSVLSMELVGAQQRQRDKLKEQQTKQLEGQKAKLAQKRIKVVLETKAVFERILQIRTEEVRKKLDSRLKKIYAKISFKRYTPELTDDFRLELTKAIGTSDEAVARGTGENQILSLAFVGAIADLARERYDESSAKDSGLAGFQGGYLSNRDGFSLWESRSVIKQKFAKAIPELAPQVVVFVSKSQGLGAVQGQLASKLGERYVISYWTPKSDVANDTIELDGREHPYISASGNDYEWAEAMEVPIAKERS